MWIIYYVIRYYYRIVCVSHVNKQHSTSSYLYVQFTHTYAEKNKTYALVIVNYQRLRIFNCFVGVNSRQDCLKKYYRKIRPFKRCYYLVLLLPSTPLPRSIAYQFNVTNYMVELYVPWYALSNIPYMPREETACENWLINPLSVSSRIQPVTSYGVASVE